MNKSELIEVVAERAGSDRAVARRHVDAVFDAIVDGVAAGDRVLVTGFGTFDRQARPARTARNPRTGQAVEVTAADVPRFRFGQTFKNRVTGGGGTGTAAATAATGVVTEVVGEATGEVAASKKAKKPKKGKKEIVRRESPGKATSGRATSGKATSGKKVKKGKKAAAKAR